MLVATSFQSASRRLCLVSHWSGLGRNHQDGPRQSSWELPCLPNVNHEDDQDVPVGLVWSVLPRSRCQPPLEMLR